VDLLVRQWLHGPPDASSFARGASVLGEAKRGGRLQNRARQGFDVLEHYRIGAPVGGERGEPQGKLGGLLRELIHQPDGTVAY
jgi:hypothetical protein